MIELKLLNRAHNAGLSDIIISATTAKGWSGLKTDTKGSPVKCHFAYGLHPMFMGDHQQQHLDKLKTASDHRRVPLQ